ncbi:siderophore-interacting protein [Streptomyces sp. JCM 18897]
MTTTPTAPARTPFRFFDVEVRGSRRLSPSLVRLTFGGEELALFESGGRDQSCSLFLPHPGQRVPRVPVEAGENWWAAYRAMPEQERAVMRSYTVRAQRRADDGTTEFDVDFALHGDTGPACRWAARALPGDRVVVLGPAVTENVSVRFRPPASAAWALIWADLTSLPATEAILEWLPAGFPVRLWIEVPHAADRRELATAADAEITWLVADEGAPSAAEAVRAAELPAGEPYAWIAGEAGRMRRLRRHLVGERGFDRRAVTFVGYWREGASEEQLRAESLATGKRRTA